LPTNKVTVSDIQNFLLPNNGINYYICLTGGEPLLSDEFFTIIKGLRNVVNSGKIGFFSSGCIYVENGQCKEINLLLAKELKIAGTDFAYISVYSHITSIHDWITRIPGSLEATIESIKNLINSGISVRVNYVLMKSNNSSIIETIKYLDKLGVDEIRFLPLVKHGRAEQAWKDIGLDRCETKQILQSVISKVRQQDIKIRISVAGFPDIWDCRPFGNGDKCQAGCGLLYVDVNGNIFPCACKKKDSNYLLANIRDGDIMHLLKYSNFKKLYHEACLQD